MAISAMEYGDTKQSQLDDGGPIDWPMLTAKAEILAVPTGGLAKLLFHLDRIAELDNSPFVAEDAESFNQSNAVGQATRAKGQEEVLKLAETALGILEAELQAGKSETLMKFLTTMSQFHNYSFNNLMLIAMQNPDATHIAGFQAWKQLGRHVMKGEHGIRILAPIIMKRKTEDGEGSTSEQSADAEQPQKMIVGFKVVSVFDISQTDGEPLPDIGTVKGDPGENLSRIEELIRSKGIELGYEKLHGPEGVSQGGKILVELDLGPAKTFAVLAHELAHEMLHKGDKREETTKSQRELEAEAVAFVVCHAVGIESIHHAADYIQLYNGDVEALGKSLDAIRKTSAEIIGNILGQ
jgi:hypothetical protein